jgi:antitoxin MazE
MKTHLISIGNSRGIRIPKAILEQCRIEKDIELELKEGAILIRPIKKKSRAGWARAFQAMRTHGEDRLFIDDGLDPDLLDWEW